MLSTPTASTRNGMTSMVSKVVGIPAYPHIPIEDKTDPNTIRTPPIPRNILVSTC